MGHTETSSGLDLDHGPQFTIPYLNYVKVPSSSCLLPTVFQAEGPIPFSAPETQPSGLPQKLPL